jgi:hypothetical protein
VEKSTFAEQHAAQDTGQSHGLLKPPIPTNKGRNMLAIAQSPSPLTKSVGRISKLSYRIKHLGRTIFPTRPLFRNQWGYPLACRRLRQCLANTQQFNPSPNPSGKNSTSKNPIFPEKNQNPPEFMGLKTSKSHSGGTGQKISRHRKTPAQTYSLPQKCSTIHPQQFPRGSVYSGTSRPPLVQLFDPKTRNNDERSKVQDATFTGNFKIPTLRRIHLLRPRSPMNRSAAKNPANSAGTAVFAAESGSLATSESISGGKGQEPLYPKGLYHFYRMVIPCKTYVISAGCG